MGTPSSASRWAALLRAAGVRDVVEQAPMAAYTAFRLGGPADLLVSPSSLQELRAALRVAWEHGIPVTAIGRGSNLLVSDRGIEGLVIRFGRGLSAVRLDGQRLVAQAGAPLPSVAWQAALQECSGLEFGVMIPGSVGGAIAMNAGAHQASIGPLVRWVRCLTLDGQDLELAGSAMGFSYRRSVLQERPDLVVAEAELQLEKRPREAIVRDMERHLEARRRTQPLGEPGAGSIFKNPPGDFAGRLIEQAGLKGWRRGDVEISPVHANFIVNKGHARCEEVLQAIRMVQRRVYERFGVRLGLEVRLVGRFTPEELAEGLPGPAPVNSGVAAPAALPPGSPPAPAPAPGASRPPTRDAAPWPPASPAG